jgi:hypothetical protein
VLHNNTTTEIQMVTSLIIQESLIEINKSETYESMYDRMITEAVESAFSSLYGTRKQILYLHLSEYFNINKQDIPCKLEDFADAN